MSEIDRVLQPLNEAEDAIAKLQDYKSTAELAAAVQATHAAVQKSLRYLLRADKGSPDDLRLSALSPSELTHDRLMPTLRQRDLISLDLAGQIHELEQATRRAEAGSVRASDGDAALRVIDHLRAEIQALGERSVRTIAHGAVESGPLHEAHSVPSATESGRFSRLPLVAAVGVGLAVIIWFAFLHDSATEKGIKQFEDKQYSASEQTLRNAFDDDPSDVQAAYYLAILYRRSQRFDDAGQVLRRGIDKSPKDAYLREELGNLFMDLGQPNLAVKQYRSAQELSPNTSRFWVKLVGAMRAAGDPEADVVAEKAPAEARALLRTGK